MKKAGIKVKLTKPAFTQSFSSIQPNSAEVRSQVNGADVIRLWLFVPISLQRPVSAARYVDAGSCVDTVWNKWEDFEIAGPQMQSGYMNSVDFF